MNYRLIWKSAAIAAVGMGLVAGALAQGAATTGTSAPSGNAAKNAFAENSELFIGVSLVKSSSATIPTAEQTYSEDSPAGWDLNYRYHTSDWVAFDVRYEWSKGTHAVPGYGSQSYSVDAYEGEWSADAAITFPTHSAIKPYVLFGAGLVWFGPTSYFGNTAGADGQGRFAYVWGAGADLKVSHSLAIRAEYRGLYFRMPDFGLGPNTAFNNQFGDVWVTQAIPTIGLVLHF